VPNLCLQRFHERDVLVGAVVAVQIYCCIQVRLHRVRSYLPKGREQHEPYYVPLGSGKMKMEPKDTRVCPLYSTVIRCNAKQLVKLTEPTGPGAGWHLKTC